MRTAFIDELIVQARINPKIFLVVGDLGYSVIEPFATEFPHRFLNAGVAEQNMAGLAAGLASEGYHVFIYSIANFPTLRCLEQIRNDVCYHGLPVTVVAVGAGVAYGSLGYSHHAVQDIAIFRTLPGLHLFSPADPGEAREAVKWLSKHPRPSYLRLGKAGEKPLYPTGAFSPNPVVVAAGNPDVAIVATGSVLAVALDAIAIETGAGRLAPTVVSMPWLHPLNGGVLNVLRGFKRIICIEEHVREGGLREMLAANLPRSIGVSGLAIASDAISIVGSQQYIREISGITTQRLQDLIQYEDHQGIASFQ
jgi:transketolase